MLERPYRTFFPLGIFGACLALLVWVSPAWRAQAFRWHADLMLSAFLLPIICGFLLYTAPRFFSARPARWLEVLGLWLACAAQLVLFAADQHTPYLFLRSAIIFYLAWFVISRVRSRPAPRPEFTAFLIVALGLGAGASLVQAAAESLAAVEHPPRPFVAAVLAGARYAFLYGAFWTLFTGMGVRLFPMFTLSTRPRVRRRFWQRTEPPARALYTVAAVVLGASFLFSQTPLARAALVVRALVMLLIAWQGWLLFHKSARRGILPFFLKLGLGTALVGLFATSIWPAYEKHLTHLVFGAGLGLGTVCMATRVILAHERADLGAEVRSRAFTLALTLIYLAVWTRVTAVITASYTAHLSYAALLFVAGLVIWALEILRCVRAARRDAGQTTR